MKKATVYQVQITVGSRRTTKLCFLQVPSADNVHEALQLEIDDLNKQIDDYDEVDDDDEDGHGRDVAEREIEALGHFSAVVLNANWSNHREWEKGTLQVTVAGTRIGEIHVEEVQAYKV